MKNLLYLFILLLFVACESNPKEAVNQNTKPNIIYILADDLGYGELGVYGQEKIATPNIDQLAKNGMQFTQHYTGAPVCAPARCVLMTGKHSGHAYIRGNDEWGERGDVWDYLATFRDSTLEGHRPLPDNTITIGNLLQDQGYKTGIVGKWGLGAPHISAPNDRGFDFFYGYICQRQAHTYFPLHLYKNRARHYLQNDTVPPRTKLAEGADPLDMASYAPFYLKDYSPDLMFNEITDFVDANQENPFYLYWATPIPHAPLQAPQRWVDYYVEKFGDEEPYLGERSYFPHRYPHAAYAAMVSYLDEQVGLLVQQLKDLGLYENTLIVFSSDNGPTFNGGTDSPWFDSAGPFASERGRGKGYVYEGGIRVPMIASWPGHIAPGTTSDLPSAFWDVLPTLSEVAGGTIPEDTDGISFLPTLLGEGEQKTHEYLYWEFPSYGGQQAIRMGDWKLVRQNLLKGEATTELYNLEKDPEEQINAAEQFPEILAKAQAYLEEAHVQAEIERFRIPALGDVVSERK